MDKHLIDDIPKYAMEDYHWPSPEGLLILIGVLIMISCGGNAEPADEATQFKPDLQVVVPSARLRAAPSPEADVVETLEKGEKLLDLQEVSDQITRIEFGERTYEAPWLLVRSRDGNPAWVFTREVAPLSARISAESFRQQKYLLALFGQQTVHQIASYQTAWDNAASAPDLADTYRLAQRLRDSLVVALETDAYRQNEETLPDLFWLDQYLPAHVPQLVAEGTTYYLFHDYAQWRARAAQTPEKEDDRFFELLIRCFPQDSIEYFYPSWEIQTWDYGGFHLLGRGIVYDLLSDIATFVPQARAFTEPAVALKGRILDSITREGVGFWEAAPKVRQELDSIIRANWSIFTAADRIALSTRRQQLDEAGDHGIRFDARSGTQ